MNHSQNTDSKPAKHTQRSGFWFVWSMPLLLAALTLFGLIIALVKTGVWHGAAWLGLAAPIVIGLWYSFARPRRQK